MKLILQTVALGAALCAWNAQAQGPGTLTAESSKELAETCAKQTVDSVLLCGEYVLGVHDAIAAIRALGFLKDDQVAFCITRKTGRAGIIGAVRKYYAENPTERERGQEVMAPVSVMMALMKAFPCSKK